MPRLADLSKGDRQGVRAANNLDRTGESRHDADKTDGFSRSYGTNNTNQNLLRVVGTWTVEQKDIAHLNKITPEQAERFLQEKSVDVTDKSLAGYAVVLEQHLKNNCGYDSPKLERPASEIPTIQASRAYTPAAVQVIESKQSDYARLSTTITSESGLRAHELHTLQRLNGPADRQPSAGRSWSDERFTGREHWARYTVEGKGGLVREIRMTPETAVRLEAVKVAPRTVFDRSIAYRDAQYNVMGGKSFSNSFSKTSLEQLGHSYGAHGLRHTYAQDRMKELCNAGKSWDDAKLIVSQELGHFRPSITDIYLR